MHSTSGFGSTRAGLSGLIGDLFGSDIVVEDLWLSDIVPPLLPDEEAYVASALPKRRREFAAGRWCARRALARLGSEGYPLLPGADRAPRWPAGITGSIAHTDVYCVTVVARTTRYRSLGIDVEPDAPIEPELWPSLCTERELTWLQSQPETEQGWLVRLIFSAKEAFYKLQHPLTGVFLDFTDVELNPLLPGGRFTISLLKPAGPFGTSATFTGHWLRAHGLLITAMALPA